MPRKKTGRTIVPWLTAKPDGREKRFIQVGNSLLLSKSFQALGPGPQHLYLCMAMESGGRQTFRFPRTTALKYGITPSSLARYVTKLEEKGFLQVYSRKRLRQPNDYLFTLSWRAVPPPSFSPSPLAICSISPSN